MDGGLGRATCWHTRLLHRAWLQRWQRLQGSSQGLGGYAQSWHRCLALVLLLLLAICFKRNKRYSQWQTEIFISESQFQAPQNFTILSSLSHLQTGEDIRSMTFLWPFLLMQTNLLKTHLNLFTFIAAISHVQKHCMMFYSIIMKSAISEQFGNLNSREHCGKVFKSCY